MRRVYWCDLFRDLNNYYENIGFTESLLLKELSNQECSTVINYLSTWRGHWSGKHMSYLMNKSILPGSGVASALSCDLSRFSWDLLIKKELFDEDTMKAIISLGARITMRDVKNIISNTKEETIETRLKIRNRYSRRSLGIISACS